MPFFETMLGSAVLNVGCEIITNVMDPARKSAWHRVVGWWEQGKTPENHDVLRATHNAYVEAMRVMASAAKNIAVSDEERATARALADLCGQSRFHEFRWDDKDDEHLPLDATRKKIDALLDRQRLEGETAAWRAYNQLVLDDLTIWQIDRNPLFDTLFLDGVGNHVPWHLCFRQQFAEIVKADQNRPEGERAFRILTLEALAELKGMGAVVVDGLARLEQKIDEQTVLLRELVEHYRPAAEKLKVTNDALIALAQPIAGKIDDPQQALDALGTALEEFLRVRESAKQGTNLGDLVDQTLRNIAAANERGELDKGAAAGERGFADWQDQQEAARQAGLKLIEANVEQHRLRFDAAAMAKWIGERLKLLGGGTIDFEALRGEQDEWYQRGLVRGLRLDLDVSIGLARLSIDIAQSDTDRAACQNDLAISLNAQAARTGGAAGLALQADAVIVYRSALTVYTESAMPAQWAMTQNNLGLVLRTQGERTGGEAGLMLLADAVTAYRAALTVYTESAMPVDWAMTQNNLGVALSTQGVRTGGEAGLALLAEAVAACRAALTVRSESAMPVYWAMTQENIALAFEAMAALHGDPLPDLREAEAAVLAALQVYTPEHMSYDYGTATELLTRIRAKLADRTH